MINTLEDIEVGAISAPATYFKVVHRAFQTAAQAAGTVQQFYDIGGYSIKLCFAGRALIQHVTPALTHRAAAHDQTPDLTVCLWDTASTGVVLPPPTWKGDAYGARGEIKGFNDARNQTNFQLDGPALRGVTVNMLDHELNTALYWVLDAGQFPYHERSGPLRIILNWWMSQRGRQLIHAGAVGTAEGGVLLAGKGGSGKSTAALSCLQSKLLYASDDYLLLGSDPLPFAHSLYSSAKLDGDQIHRFPHLWRAVSNKERLAEEKAILFLNDYCPEKLTAGFPIRAILLPRVTGLPETKLKKTSGAACLTALAPSSIFQFPGAGSKTFHHLAQLAQQVPSYALELGTDIPRIPDLILKLLSEIGS